tara:strand:+ start:23691 stop:24878 length:1188 start_codon:yes stop_codon:yes gene_type:complete
MKSLQRSPLFFAVRAVSVAGSMALVATPAFADFTEVTTDNPFAAITSGTFGVSLTLVDLDSDGDLDALVWHSHQGDVAPFNAPDVSLYENTGTRTAPVFTQVQDASGYGYGGDNFDVNPFANSWGNPGLGHPVSAGDLDKDGLDDFVGGRSGYYSPHFLHGVSVNDGNGKATGLTSLGDNTSANSMFAGTDIIPGGYGSPLLLDLDNDTDTDVITISAGLIYVYQNNGLDAVTNVLQLDSLDGANHPFTVGVGRDYLSQAYIGAPMAAADLDNDGDLDILMGVARGPADMRYFINTGSASMAQFEELAVAGLDVSTAAAGAAPATGDIDGDGDADVVIVEYQGSGTATATFRLFRNDSATQAAPSPSNDSGSLGASLLGLFVGAAWLRRRKLRKS